MTIENMYKVSVRYLKASTAKLRNARSGAITVDWVVITAGVVGLAATVQIFINPIIVGEHGQSINAGVQASVHAGINGSLLGD